MNSDLNLLSRILLDTKSLIEKYQSEEPTDNPLSEKYESGFTDGLCFALLKIQELIDLK